MEKYLENNNQHFCDLCYHLSLYFQAQIIAALDQACRSVPLEPFADDCVVFVEAKAPEILTKIADGIKPRELCHELLVCPAVEDADREEQKEKEIQVLTTHLPKRER